MDRIQVSLVLLLPVGIGPSAKTLPAAIAAEQSGPEKPY
jgi:hypothetical protein